MERFAPPSPLVGGPHPEETIEAPELRSLRAAAKQCELLPEGQFLEGEVSAGSERRTQRAQQSEYEGHRPPWLARRWAVVQSLGQDFGKRQPRGASHDFVDPSRFRILGTDTRPNSPSPTAAS